MSSDAFDAIAMIDATFPRLVIYVEVLEVVIKVDRACTEVTSEKGSMSSEDGGDVYVTFATERDGDAGLPLMKVCDDGDG